MREYAKKLEVPSLAIFFGDPGTQSALGVITIVETRRKMEMTWTKAIAHQRAEDELAGRFVRDIHRLNLSPDQTDVHLHVCPLEIFTSCIPVGFNLMLAPEWTARAFQYANSSTPATAVTPTRVVDENRLIAMPGASVIAQWMYLKEASPLSMKEMATIGDHLGEVLAPQLRDEDKQSMTKLSSITGEEVNELLGREF